MHFNEIRRNWRRNVSVKIRHKFLKIVAKGGMDWGVVGSKQNGAELRFREGGVQLPVLHRC